MNSKQKYVQSAFSKIAKRYDLTNSLLSFGLHHFWKDFTVSQFRGISYGKFLDVCSGTGDLAIRMAKNLNGSKIKALDFCSKMIEFGKTKTTKSGLDKKIEFIQGDAENLPFKNNCFDGVTVGFGIRNVEHISKAFSEMHRVLKPQGKAVCLEFSNPPFFLFRFIYLFYLSYVLPIIGGLFGGDFDSYKYLSNSIKEFPNQERLKKIMEDAGFKDVKYYNLTFGIVAVHVGVK
ncbi:bifunctional demethylmenaquinone methyltransferase/2-methoxy-6-polyprenyl-1,4-benzoquinol methylase UbiE [Candidatus Oleimmundimicrobium sp.]|uniref:bifunctional demethylmenaquinone methyltransferase/2-methoxy-6-polyprenyl-1,4-benzoquinol methylase UbiE n=1 Tax=Candidatus Oleimmundimicrobium sp. TaxID=3060597 RepID=UPI002718FF99|nr:bifunctional demethylmenaquinone methyltransferase/2-methoxy-6-polyprenyl-1,4-benzoquinol methylase UbiE [Candidatus Oleimmundimicrobium sp.]MDO8885580.1 bifunctional demethylmenaquinone methyltransferase/2-methoxy-6-polyprenyl-1,4-benzoquinol methylase UbiE [Candidatus Oleimmundimicrobium sp.]